MKRMRNVGVQRFHAIDKCDAPSIVSHHEQCSEMRLQHPDLNHVCFRFSSADCLKPLGMWNNEIKSNQLTVSSSAPNHGKDKARYTCCGGKVSFLNSKVYFESVI